MPRHSAVYTEAEKAEIRARTEREARELRHDCYCRHAERLVERYLAGDNERSPDTFLTTEEQFVALVTKRLPRTDPEALDVMWRYAKARGGPLQAALTYAGHDPEPLALVKANAAEKRVPMTPGQRKVRRKQLRAARAARAATSESWEQLRGRGFEPAGHVDALSLVRRSRQDRRGRWWVQLRAHWLGRKKKKIFWLSWCIDDAAWAPGGDSLKLKRYEPEAFESLTHWAREHYGVLS